MKLECLICKTPEDQTKSHTKIYLERFTKFLCSGECADIHQELMKPMEIAEKPWDV